MSEEKTGTGVIVGRFQTPYLTIGHRYLIDHVIRKHSRIIIFVGVTPGLPTKRNPLSFFVRMKMIQGAYPDVSISVIDDMADDALWSDQLDSRIIKMEKSSTCITLYGSRDSFVKSYTGQFQTKEIETPHQDNATDLRGACIIHIEDDKMFRSGIIHAIGSRHPSPFLTVDIAPIRETYLNETENPFAKRPERQVLFGKKKGEKHFRFVGGFVDPTDESIQAAAYRELREEVGHIATVEWKLIGEAKIDDWRYRKDDEKIFTNLFACTYIHGPAIASDDIESIEWIPVDKIKETKFMPAHVPLVKILLAYLEKRYYVENKIEANEKN